MHASPVHLCNFSTIFSLRRLPVGLSYRLNNEAGERMEKTSPMRQGLLLSWPAVLYEVILEE